MTDGPRAAFDGRRGEQRDNLRRWSEPMDFLVRMPYQTFVDS